MTWPFDDLIPLTYSMIMADPPWAFENWSVKGEKKNAKSHYDCLPLGAIQNLPVSHLASRDAVLFLWATWPMLREGIETMEAWGFRYVSGGVWHKRTVHGKSAFGTGYRLRSASEPWLLGTLGNPKTSRRHRNVIEGVVRAHSRKPEEAYAWAESYVDGPRVELFSRTDRPGWDTFGDQKGLLNASEDPAAQEQQTAA